MDNCRHCQIYRAKTQRHSGFMLHAPIPLHKLEFISLDLFHFPVVEWDGLEYDQFLLIVCMLTGYAGPVPLRKGAATGQHCDNALYARWLDVFGVPTSMLTDRGPQFVSQFWEQMCECLGVLHKTCLVGRHKGNGKCEVTGKMLGMAIDKANALTPEHNWVHLVTTVVRLYNDTVGPTGVTPNVLFLAGI